MRRLALVLAVALGLSPVIGLAAAGLKLRQSFKVIEKKKEAVTPSDLMPSFVAAMRRGAAGVLVFPFSVLLFWLIYRNETDRRRRRPAWIFLAVMNVFVFFMGRLGLMVGIPILICLLFVDGLRYQEPRRAAGAGDSPGAGPSGDEGNPS